jgi:hypothetical protein
VRETAKAAYKWCTRDSPVLKTDEVVFAINSNINKDAKENEDNDRNNFKR